MYEFAEIVPLNVGMEIKKGESTWNMHIEMGSIDQNGMLPAENME